jgi:CO/xanthine dehydrogenase FAD-binding subunit
VPIAGGTDLSDKWGNGLLTKLTHLLDLNKTSDLPRFR